MCFIIQLLEAPATARPIVRGRKVYLIMTTSSFTNTLTLFLGLYNKMLHQQSTFCNQLLISFFPFDFLGVTYPEYVCI